MKTTRLSFCIATIIVSVLLSASAPRARAFGDLDREATVDLLTSNPWKISGHAMGGWADIRIFDKDGTFKTIDHANEYGHWRIDANKIILTFPDKHTDTISLPLDPKGTAGTDRDGNPTNAVQQNSIAGNNAPAPAPSGTANGNPFLDAKENTSEDLSAAIVKYPYSWEHADSSQTMKFNADGTANGLNSSAKLYWHQRNAQEIELWHADAPNKKIVLKFSNDYTSYVGTDFQSNHLTGHQLIPKPKNENPQPPQTVAGGGGGGSSGAFGSTSSYYGNQQAPTQAPATSISPEMQQKAADLVKTYHDSLVFVTGKEGSGSGFIAAIGKTNFLVTNAHVAADITDAAFKTLDDTPVKPGAASVAVGRDIFCMAQPAGGKPLEIMQDVESNAGIGDDVVVLGNAEGGGVINTITGKIVGIGADRVEVDAPFVPGNSGSPIIHLKTGKVIGVATYLIVNNYDATTNEKNAKPVIRRFGYRVDNVKGWQAVDWRSFRAQAAEMDKIDTLTGDLYDFFLDLEQNNGTVTPERHTNPVIKNRIDQWLADKAGNHSAEDQNMANANFLSFLKVACQSDVTAARQHMSYDYFRRELADEQQDRDAMSKAFEEIIKNIRD